MKIILYFILIVAGVFGCTSRHSVSRERVYAYTDSVMRTRLDTSCLRYNRQTQVRTRSRLKEISFSSPDSTGSQYVERIVYVAEEWGMTDSSEVMSTTAGIEQNQATSSLVSVEKEIVKQKTNRIVWLVLTLLLVSFIYFLCKTN